MITTHDIRFMREALEEARAAGVAEEIPVGAVIVKDGAVVARGRNRREETQDPTAHAEIEAMRAAARALHDRRLAGCTLYVTLEPCPMCAGAITQTQLTRLVYGAPDASYGCAGSVYRLSEDPAFPHFCPADGGVLRGECEALLGEFFERRRRMDNERGGTTRQPKEFGKMTRTEINAELAKGLASVQNGDVYTLDEVDRIFAGEDVAPSIATNRYGTTLPATKQE